MRQTATLPGGGASVRVARAFVDEILQGLNPDERWAAVLLTSELVTNVVRRTDAEIRVAADPGPPIRVEVAAAAATTEAFRAVLANAPEPAAIPNSIEQRLELVHSLASRIGLGNDPNGGGKVVWFELDRESPSGS